MTSGLAGVCGWTLTGGRGRAGLTRLVPGFAHIVGAAAHLLGHVEGQLVLARVVEVAEAHALSHVCRPRGGGRGVKGEEHGGSKPPGFL